METLVSYEHGGGIATITMDDGKVNALSPAMQAELAAALDRAEADGAPVLLSGRAGVFSAGFDLSVLRAGGPDALAMVRGGFELAVRLLEFPRPVVIACTGHAVAMGLFLSQAGDYRVGASGPYKFQANEVALGLTLPYAAVEILRYRMAPGCFDRATALAEIFPPDGALGAGLLDRVVAPELVAEVARGAAGALLGLNMDAHLATKLRARQQLRSAIRAGIDADYGAVRA